MKRASGTVCALLCCAGALGAAAGELSDDFLEFLGSFEDEQGEWLDPLELDELELPDDDENDDNDDDRNDEQDI